MRHTRNVFFVQFLVSNEPCRCAGDGSREGIEELWVQTFGDRHMFLVLFGHSKLGFPAAGAFFALLWCPFFLCGFYSWFVSPTFFEAMCLYSWSGCGLLFTIFWEIGTGRGSSTIGQATLSHKGVLQPDVQLLPARKNDSAPFGACPNLGRAPTVQCLG